jgi:thiol:disulfide interchange protein DsbD
VKLLQTPAQIWHLICVRRLVIISIWLCSALFALAQTGLPLLGGGSFSSHHTQAKLILSADTAKPGDTIWAGVDLKMDADWHTYWKNPGAAGMATKIEWQLPPGISAGEIQWPLPERFPPVEVTTYGYEKEVVLLVPLTIATNVAPSQIDLKAKVSWLECKEVCVPANQNVEAKLNIGSESKTSTDAATIGLWKKKIPEPAVEFHAHALWNKTTESDVRMMEIELAFSPEPSAVDFYPDANENFEIRPDTKWGIGKESGWIWISKTVKKFSGDWPKEISGVVVLQTNNLSEGFEIKIPLWESRTNVSPASSVSENPNSETTTTPALPLMLLYAFIGGLILNIMPCVLPVIALKILGFVSESKSSPRRVRALGGLYAIGVLSSFLVLAAIVIGARAAGHFAGWGMQFGSPVFIVCLTTLVALVALNLFGVFEVTLGGKTLDAAGNLASRHGGSGAFFNGVLATTLATPCTAPFLAPALGFAFAQTAPVIALVFLTVGLGLAAPYVLLSWNPAWLKFLPKPGAWMERFKIAMGFPMLATVVWLYSIAASSYGKNVFWLGAFLVIVALAAWIFGEFVQRGRTRKGLSLAIVLILLASGYAFALEKELNWRVAMPPDATGSLRESPDGIEWQRWSPEAVTSARADGKIVLVDFTADWCLTCQVNKKIAIEIPSVREKLKDLNAVALIGDYTHFPENISAELQRYNRAGVPLVLVYPKNPDAPPIVLPEVLTPGTVLNALARAEK